MKLASAFSWEYRRSEDFSALSAKSSVLGTPFLAVDFELKTGKQGQNTQLLTALLLEDASRPGYTTFGSIKYPHSLSSLRYETGIKQLQRSNKSWLVIKHADVRQLKSLLENVWSKQNLAQFELTLGVFAKRDGGVPGNPVQLDAGNAWPLADDGFTYEHQTVKFGAPQGEAVIVVERGPGNKLEAVLIDLEGKAKWRTAGVVGRSHPVESIAEHDALLPPSYWLKKDRPALCIKHGYDVALRERMKDFWKPEVVMDLLMLTPDPALPAPVIGPVEFRRGDTTMPGRAFDPFDL